MRGGEVPARLLYPARAGGPGAALQSTHPPAHARELPVSDAIPFDRLGIPEPLRPRLNPEAPTPAKLAIARGLLPMPPEVLLGACYALLMDPTQDVVAAADETIRSLPYKQLQGALSERTHPKILEYLAEFRGGEPELDGRLLRLRALNTRAARLIARRGNATICEDISRNQERLLMSPEVVLELHANPACTDATLERATEFLRMEGDLPPLPELRPFRAPPPAATPSAPTTSAPALAATPEAPAPVALAPLQAPPAPVGLRPGQLLDMDCEAEVQAALAGLPSPAMEAVSGAAGGAFADRLTMELGRFQLDYYDEGDFDDLLTRDFSQDGGADEKTRKSLVRLISEMNVTQKIKLAYLGNKEARAILVRDRIRSVPTAVIRSGRLTDAEVVVLAADRNLSRDVIRQIAMSKEYTRKYPVQVALVNNPKTPLATAMGYLKFLNKRDLFNAARNKNVSSALAQAAYKLSRTKES